MARDLRNLLVNSIHDRALRRSARQHLQGRLLDIGCGTKPYERRLTPRITWHIGLDGARPFHHQARTDIVGTTDRLPVLDASFDAALCTATLEHLREPESAIRECHRILRHGGVAIYTVPLIWHVHSEPYDYYRFTQYGLEHLFRKVGFEIVELQALSGFWVTVGQLFVYYLYRFQRGPMRYVPVIPLFGLVVQLFAYAFDRLDRAESWTWMYLVTARKP